MIECAFFGVAFTDCEVKESHRGGYASLLVVTSNSEDEDSPSTLLVRLVVPIGLMSEAMTIKKGDRIYVEGACTVGIWNTPKGAKPSVSVKVHHIRKARIGEHKEAPKLEPSAEFVAAALSRPMPIEELLDLPAFIRKPQHKETSECQQAD